MLGVAGLIVLVALVGAVVLTLLCVGLWRRLVALGRELGALSELLEQVGAPTGPGADGGPDLERDLAALRRRHPGVEVEVRPTGSGPAPSSRAAST